jgi:CP family cyanate transporter-like MFS transporter
MPIGPSGSPGALRRGRGSEEAELNLNDSRGFNLMQEKHHRDGRARKGAISKWHVLILVTLVHMLVVGLPWTVMPVLFSAAASELGLSLGQIGLLWSMLPIGAAAVALPGGMLGDRVGFTRAIGIGCLAVAVTGGLRAMATNLAMLTISMFLCGAAVALVFPNLQRIAAVFFPKRQLGLATGISISGFAIGGVLTTALSATVIMPLVGSWRNVLFVYSGLCAAMGAVWWLVMGRALMPGRQGDVEVPRARPSFRESIVAVFRVRDAWLLSIGNLGVVGSFISLNGYLPVYLEKIGLAKNVGDTMSSTLFVASIVGAIAIPSLADRVGAAKAVMIASAVITSATILLFSVAGPALFWVLIPLAGCLTQGIGALVISHAVQIKAIGYAYAGTALGLIGGFSNLGGFVMPAIGGRLAEANRTWPFILWGLAALSGTACFAFIREQRRDRGAKG